MGGVVVAAVTAAVLATAPAAAAAPAVFAGTWGTAIEVPGTAALNQGFGFGGTGSVSCASPGNCSAGGNYTDSSGAGQAFVVSEVNGTWGTAIEVPGTAALNQGGYAWAASVSCASPGNCSAGGTYSDTSGHFQVFVVSEVNGTWGTAEQVPGTAALNQGDAEITSVSCASPGNCAAAGFYSLTYTSHLNAQAFVVSEVNGTWGTAEQVPGTAALNQGGYAWTTSVSCAPPDDCSAGGFYSDSAGHWQAFVVGAVHGTWGTAGQVPGIAALDQGGFAEIMSVSCTPAGNCGADGQYADSAGHEQAFVVSQVHGTWGTAEQIPGTAALNQGGYAFIDYPSSLSCPSAGNCAAGGIYSDSSGSAQVFVVSEVHGTWGTAERVPGAAALNQGGFAEITAVSCAPPGTCGAGGIYTDNFGNYQAFVVSDTDGTWGTAEQVPGTAALNTGGYAQVNSVSCAPAGTCSAGGFYTDSSFNGQAFVVNQAHQQPGAGQAAASPRHAPARSWHWRAPATCHVVITGPAPRGPVLPRGAAARSRCLIPGGGRWLLPGYPGLPRH
jgi:hypothetical protein